MLELTVSVTSVWQALPHFRSDVTLMVVAVASPAKATEFLATANLLPASNFYCSPSRSAYKSLGFYDDFGAELGPWNAAVTPLQGLARRGVTGLAEMREAAKDFWRMNPVGLVSGEKGFNMEDAKATTQVPNPPRRFSSH